MYFLKAEIRNHMIGAGLSVPDDFHLLTTHHLAKLLEAKRYLKSRGLGTVERITQREGK